MRAEEKRASRDSIDMVQAGNRRWWTERTMSYDWKSNIERRKFSPEWYDEIDKRFVFGARLFAHETVPFDKIIPFQQLEGQAVLEIGCGMGLHTELMTRAGAAVTAIDISDTSVDATRRRLDLKGLPANVLQMDACKLSFPDDSFDFVWSWGVIHHSAQTGRIIREIHRVLTPGGETRVMVYNLEGAGAYARIVRDYLFGFWCGKTLDECLWKRSDGYMARYYTKDMLSDIFLIFFENVSVESLGQDADAFPLPGPLRRPLLHLVPNRRLKALANCRGSFLFVTASKKPAPPSFEWRQ
jgi:2-polyprenyl-3-methyl-5-hydroxy-6-metoxy-1,4-benzoquinol methylase